MITHFRVQNYKALRDVSLELTPIHVLIGPNDSGKTSILEAVEAMGRSADYPLADCFQGRWEGGELVWRQDKSLPVSLEAVFHDDDRYQLTFSFATGRKVSVTEIAHDGSRNEGGGFEYKHPHSTHVRLAAIKEAAPSQTLTTFYAHLSGVLRYRWVPEQLALPAAQGAVPFHMEPSGFGLVSFLEDVLLDSRERFARIEGKFLDLFPEFETVKIRRETAYKTAKDSYGVLFFQNAPGNGLHFKQKGDATEIPASQVSDGVLIILAYLTILDMPHPPRVLLIEEPENGIHPKRLEMVITILRDLIARQSHTQVILTTHSPYLLDHFKAEEVTLCLKDKDGAVKTRRLSSSKAVREQIDVFTLGEIWTAEGEERLMDADSTSETARK